MNAAAVCTDSSALLRRRDAERLGIDVVPIEVTLDGEPVDERVDVDAFYDRLTGGARVTTSQPSPADFAAAYERASARGARAVLSVHLDARVSGTVGAAEAAAREAPLPVTVVDTGTVSFGVAVCVRAAAEALAAGGSVHSAAALARRLGATVRNVFVAANAPGGRVSEASGWAVRTFADGAARPLAACDAPDEAVDVMTRYVLSTDGVVRAAVGHGASPARRYADRLAAALTGSAAVAGVERYRVGPAVGAHSGPLSFGAFSWPEAV